jgi:hypothetical protein
MLRMSLRDPRVSKAVQVAFVAMSALWLVNFSTQETHSTFSWVLRRSPRWIFVFAVARHLEAHRVVRSANTPVLSAVSGWRGVFTKLEYLILNQRAHDQEKIGSNSRLLFLPPAPESDSDFRREPENSDYHELENLIFNQRAYAQI